MQILFLFFCMDSMQMKKNERRRRKSNPNNVFSLSSQYLTEPDVPVAFQKTFSQVAIQLEIINSINLHDDGGLSQTMLAW